MPREPGELADETWRVTSGYHRDRDGDVHGPGETFRPTVRQVQGNTLKGKAERVKVHDNIRSTGADIGLRALEWGSDAALQKAIHAKPPLTEEEMEAVGPSGATGYVTADVNEALEARDA